MRRPHRVFAAGLAAVLLAVAAPSGTALAQQAPPVTYVVDETRLPSKALSGTDTERVWGVLDGAGYRMEVPANWNASS